MPKSSLAFLRNSTDSERTQETVSFFQENVSQNLNSRLSQRVGAHTRLRQALPWLAGALLLGIWLGSRA